MAFDHLALISEGQYKLPASNETVWSNLIITYGLLSETGESIVPDTPIGGNRASMELLIAAKTIGII